MIKLRTNEQKTLLSLGALGGRSNMEKLVNTSGLIESAVWRASLVLAKKKAS